MTSHSQETLLQHPAQFTSRKEQLADDLSAWIDHYLEMAVLGVRSDEVYKKIRHHLGLFSTFFTEQYRHNRISTCVKRDIRLWQKLLKKDGLAASTINSPTKGVRELPLPPLEPRTLTEAQVRSLKSICDRLAKFHELKGRKWKGDGGLKAMARPLRDRALIFLMLSTGLRREEVVRLDLEQLDPSEVDELRRVKKARLMGVKGKGGSERTVFLSQDARLALAEYLEKERMHDVGSTTAALFLSANSRSARKVDGRLSTRSTNLILEQIGRWHDSEVTVADRRISPLRPHDLRHTFAFQLSQITGSDAYELERRLGHRSQRYIQRYTNPPEDVAAGYVEEF
jgi:integrase